MNHALFIINRGIYKMGHGFTPTGHLLRALIRGITPNNLSDYYHVWRPTLLVAPMGLQKSGGLHPPCC